MILLLIIFGFFLLLLLWVLYTPILLTLNSHRDEYSIKMPGIASGRIMMLDDRLLIRMRILFFKKDFYPLESSSKSKKKKAKKDKKKKRNKKKRSRMSFKQIRALLRTFKIQRFIVEIDTDSYVTNAYLHPLFWFLNRYPNVDMSVNYDGRLSIDLLVQNRPSRIVWLFIKEKFT